MAEITLVLIHVEVELTERDDVLVSAIFMVNNIS